MNPSFRIESEGMVPSDSNTVCLESLGPIEVPVPPHDGKEDLDSEEENYSTFKSGAKVFIVVLASASAFMSPFAVNIYMPAVPDITNDLDIDSSQTLLSVTTYMIFQGISPSVWAPLSDTYGRRPILILTFIVFLIANLGLSFTRVYWLLLVLRMLQACGASSAISIGAGCISDVSRRKERGTYMGFFQTGTLLGPAVGPIVGGLVSQTWNWHAVFFFLSAFGGAYLLLMILILPESLRLLVGDGSLQTYGIWRTLIPISMTDKAAENTKHNIYEKKWMHKPPPLNLRTMGFDKAWRTFGHADLALMITSFSIPFGVYTMVSSSLSPTLRTAYQYDSIISGLCFIPLGVGSAIGSIVSGRLLDYDYAKASQKHGDNMNLHHARLRHALLFNVLFTVTTIANGWCIDYKVLSRPVHIAAPMVLHQTILVDLSPGRAASVTAALNIGRCLVGAAFVAAVQYVIDDIGNGWTFTIFGLGSLVLSAPLLEFVIRRGPHWHAARENKSSKGSKTEAR
ncbi:hypothetical protein MBRA1_003952b, partial [Malassezia brasiliensis]